MGECSVCGHPWVVRDGDHAEWCPRIREMLEGQRTNMGQRAQCGTYAAAQSHYNHGEPLCEPCREARRAYKRNRAAIRAEVGAR